MEATEFQRQVRRWALVALVTSVLVPFSLHAAPSIEVKWRVQSAKLPTMAWRPRAWGGPVVIADKGLVIFAGASGLSARYTSDGAERWQWKVHDGVESSPVVGAGVVYACSADGQLSAHQVVDGKPVWAPAQLRASVRGPLGLDGIHVYALAAPGAVYAIDRKSGQISWRKKVLTSREFLVDARAGPLVLGSRVVVGDATGRVSALAARDGATIWTRKLGGNSTLFRDVGITPVAMKAGRLLVSSHNAGLYALNAADGSLIWRYAVEGAARPVVTATKVFMVVGGEALHCLGHDGKRRWRRQLNGNALGPLMATPYGLLSSEEDGITLRRQRDGLPLKRWNDGFGFSGSPALIGADIFVMSNAQVAYRLRVHR
ncbi:MAG TPA: hypothetical protein DCQ06_06855 [Myxococcales bacterium]|nr:hypothetical protein [Myxococcales bacterium]